MILIGVVLAMILMALIATWIPAQRAFSVDPRMLLRDARDLTFEDVVDGNSA